jgi:hypothetical protein
MEEYLTESVLRGILEEFQWPVPYTLEDDEPDGVFVIFPNCKLYFSEGDRIEVHFLSESSGVEPWLSLFDALRAVRSTSTPDSLPAEPRLIEDIASGPSLERLKNSIRDACTLLLTYLRPTLAGNFWWVEAAVAAEPHVFRFKR